MFYQTQNARNVHHIHGPRCLRTPITPPAATKWSRLLQHDIICNEGVTMIFQWGGICPW